MLIIVKHLTNTLVDRYVLYVIVSPINFYGERGHFPIRGGGDFTRNIRFGIDGLMIIHQYLTENAVLLGKWFFST